jgi:hypothetical protein
LDKDQTTWHKFHVENKNAYAHGYSDLLEKMMDWKRYDLRQRLVYFALNFKPLWFINQSITAGFYDSTQQDFDQVGQGFI